MSTGSTWTRSWSGRRSRRLLVALVALLALPGCRSALKWEGERPVDDWTLASLFGIDLAEIGPEDPIVPDVPVRTHLRPCCAFGADLQASVGGASVPAFRIGNVIGVGDLGPHNYDSPLVAFEQSFAGSAPVTNEKNGLVYTCHGGFVDIAHVRDYADWTLYLGTEVAKLHAMGGVVDLPDEGGTRRIVLKPIPEAVARKIGARKLSMELGQWLAYQLGLWHEIVTWYGWSSMAIWPEKVSAFSPEDVYSNLVGVKLGAAAVYDRAAGTTTVYNRTMEYAIRRVLEKLGALSGKDGKDAMYRMDGLWWDSSKRLPAADVVLRRHMDVGLTVAPWTVPDFGPCAEIGGPVALPNPDRVGPLVFRDVATVEIGVEETLTDFPVPPGRDRRVTQDDFAAIIETIRAENEREFGAGADRPGGPR